MHAGTGTGHIGAGGQIRILSPPASSAWKRSQLPDVPTELPALYPGRSEDVAALRDF